MPPWPWTQGPPVSGAGLPYCNGSDAARTTAASLVQSLPRRNVEGNGPERESPKRFLDPPLLVLLDARLEDPVTFRVHRELEVALVVRRRGQVVPVAFELERHWAHGRRDRLQVGPVSGLIPVGLRHHLKRRQAEGELERFEQAPGVRADSGEPEAVLLIGVVGHG